MSKCGIFFFSSRRRHTRWPRDWSSDVCSSDLGAAEGRTGPAPGSVVRARAYPAGAPRSEERRVGEECGAYRSWTDSIDTGTKCEEERQGYMTTAVLPMIL